ncbi:TPA: recombinase family protein, partial [Escherichia coli]|nr:recombinase family protein [Escherichia coli]
MIYGYVRVSTNHQDTELQRLALESAGCERIYEEYASGRTANRPVLKELITVMKSG